MLRVRGARGGTHAAQVQRGRMLVSHVVEKGNKSHLKRHLWQTSGPRRVYRSWIHLVYTLGVSIQEAGQVVKPLWGWRAHPLKCRFTPKNARNGKSAPCRDLEGGPRFDTGRFEASIYPYSYPEELGAIPNFARTPNS